MRPRLRAARIGHVHEPHARHHVEELARQVVAGAGAGRAEENLLGLSFRERDERAHIGDAEAGMGHQQNRHGGDQRDRRQVLLEVEGRVGGQRRVDGVGDRRHQQRIAVLLRARDVVGADIAARPGPILDDEWLAEPF